MDEIAQYNIKRWEALAEANALFTRPSFDLTAAEAAEQLDPERRLGDLAGKKVLCLAGGGGKQSVMFALLGAQVTVLDLSQEQLQQDREVARHFSLSIDTIQGICVIFPASQRQPLISCGTLTRSTLSPMCGSSFARLLVFYVEIDSTTCTVAILSGAV